MLYMNMHVYIDIRIHVLHYITLRYVSLHYITLRDTHTHIYIYIYMYIHLLAHLYTSLERRVCAIMCLSEMTDVCSVINEAGFEQLRNQAFIACIYAEFRRVVHSVKPFCSLSKG